MKEEINYLKNKLVKYITALSVKNALVVYHYLATRLYKIFSQADTLPLIGATHFCLIEK